MSAAVAVGADGQQREKEMVAWERSDDGNGKGKEKDCVGTGSRSQPPNCIPTGSGTTREGVIQV